MGIKFVLSPTGSVKSVQLPSKNFKYILRQNNLNKKYIKDIMDTKPQSVKTCLKCSETKEVKLFLTTHNICKDCNNARRREKYKNNEEHRALLIKKAIEVKQKRARIKNQKKAEELEALEAEIGSENTICKYCNEIRPKTRFRHNRLKCKDCERDEPLEKLKRLVRARIFAALNNKEKNTNEYLGCDIQTYTNWLLYNDKGFTMENRGSVWHIDHVIPLSKFNLEDECQQLIAFNWRNTMPLTSSENLKKNNRIIKEQVEEHLEKLKKYHAEKNIKLPQIYIDLFCDTSKLTGTSLEPSLPLTLGNICEEHG